MSNSSEFNHGTEHRAKRHKKEIVNSRAGNSLFCVHCDEFATHPTRTALGLPVRDFHHTDKTGMKEAWEAHKNK